MQGSQREVGLQLVNGERGQQVNQMKYLQAMLSGDGNMDGEVKLRIGRAARGLGIWKQLSVGKEGTEKMYQIKTCKWYGATYVYVWL